MQKQNVRQCKFIGHMNAREAAALRRFNVRHKRRLDKGWKAFRFSAVSLDGDVIGRSVGMSMLDIDRNRAIGTACLTRRR